MFDRWKPDVLLVTPLLYFGSRQVDYVRAGAAVGHAQRARRRQLGSPHDQGLDPRAAGPDRRVERAAAHRGRRAPRRAPGTGAVTGAQAYDHWFATRPSTTRADVLRPRRAAGRPAVPALSLLVALHRALRGGRRAPVGRRRSAAAAIRTLRTGGHPRAAASAERGAVGRGRSGAFGDVSIWPRAGANPIGPEARAASTTTRCTTRTPSSA